MLAFGYLGFFVSMAIVGVSLLLIGLILLQKNRGAGLSGAFGGVGGHSAFGTKTGDFLTWVTVGLVSVFLLLNIAGNFIFAPEKLAKVQPAPAKTESTDLGGAADLPISPASQSPVAAPVSDTPTSPPANSTPANSGTTEPGN
ncbi:MAG: preprotein translocase subunit SecG [Phycisphaerae bacterium]|nr:preprotein translocase subunit SecG [Phycisphaerae bacterium]